jgi:hypothetical protein
MDASSVKLTWFGATVMAVGCVAVVLAQDRSDPTGAGGSLAALTAEVRQLRVAVEESARSQAQTQALGVYLSVQQSRIVQVASRLDAVRRDLDGATVHSQGIATALARLDDELPRITEPKERAALENQIRALRLEQPQVDLQKQQALTRESELSQALQLEDARWSDLISWLEQVIKR